MTDSSNEPDDLLSAFDLGPSWARSDAPKKDYTEHQGERRRDDRRGGKGRNFDGGQRRGGGGDRRGGGGRDGGGRPPRGKGNFKGRGGRPPGGERRLPDPAPGLKVTCLPSLDAIHRLVKEIQHRARVYSLFDVAQLFLKSRESCHLELVVDEKSPALYRNKKDGALFTSKDEAVAYFAQSDAFAEFYDVEDVETEPPAGNFQVVARCGISGEWLGPPNFHSYQTNLRRLHRERFSNMPFERYSAKVRTERGEEAVNAWLETMKKRTRWRKKDGSDDDWTFDRSQIERDFLTTSFDEVYESTHKAELPGDFSPKMVSEGVMAAVRIAGSHTRRHPAMMIPSICRMLESDHLAIFKRKGKLYCGPSRPHPLTNFDSLSERPAAIVKWLDDREGKKLLELWKALLPEGTEEPPKEWLVDLFWLLTQGHVLLFDNDVLVLPKRSQQAKKAGKKAAKKTAKKAAKKQAKKASQENAAAEPRAELSIVSQPSVAKQLRLISRMKPGALKSLRGDAKLHARRLARRDQIISLRDDE